MKETCIIVGGSHAAAQLAPSLRQEGWAGRIIVVSDESSLPYHRPPLSKDFLQGSRDAQALLIRPADFYTQQGIEFKLNRRVTSIDRAAHTVTLNDGEQLNYTKLALCTGARARQVALPGADLDGVHYLRTLEDVAAIKRSVAPGRHAVIIGGGYIGLETASVLRKMEMEVTVLEMAPRVLARVTTEELSAFYSRVHTEEGVVIKTGVSVASLQGTDHVSAVCCEDGAELVADLVVVGVGILPNTELAEAAGLTVGNGIVVDEYCQSSDADIVAVGDCSLHPNQFYDRQIRLESVPNATEQAKSAAATLCGNAKPYHALPWFWSNQYDLMLQIAGLSQGFDEVAIRGDTTSGRSFAAFYFQQGRLIAADCVNRPQEFMQSRKIISEGTPVARERLLDESIAPKQWLGDATQ